MEMRIQGNTTQNGLIVGNLQGELADFVVRKYHEEFRGTRADFDASIRQGEVLRHSNVPFNNFTNVLLRDATSNTTHVLTGEEVIQNWNSLPDKNSTYADTCGVAVFPNKGPNEEHRQRVLTIIGRSSTDVPLIVYGLKPVRCDNDEGFQFAESEYTVAKEAPFLRRDGNVEYDPRADMLFSSKKGIRVWTPDNQAGLRGVCRDGDVGLDARDDDLLSAYSDGRVQVLQDPKGLDAKFSDQYARYIVEIQGLPEDLRRTIAYYARNDPSKLERLVGGK